MSIGSGRLIACQDCYPLRQEVSENSLLRYARLICNNSDKLSDLESTLASELSASVSPQQNRESINRILTQFQQDSGAPDDSKSSIIKNQEIIR